MRRTIAIAFGAFVFLALFSAIKVLTVPATNQEPAVAAIQTEEKSQSVKLTINFGEGKQESYDMEAGKSAFELLKETGKPLKTKQYDFGVFVESVSEFRGNSSYAWLYSINGNSANEAADKYIAKPGDTIEWKYSKVEPQ